MILVDLILVVILVVALVTGARQGLLSSAGALIGFAVGAVAAFWVVPVVNAALSGVVDSPWRSMISLGVGILVFALIAGFGAWVGRTLGAGADRTVLRLPDRILGAAFGFAVAGLALALVGQTLSVAGIPGISTAMASSRVLGAIRAATPPPLTAALARLQSSVIDEGIPTLGNLLGPTLVMPEAVPAIDLADPDLERAAQSVGRVSGTAFACGRGSSGTGFVVASGLLVTNAHVVAGVDDPIVELPGRQAREGRIVYFDPIDDLAIIAVDGLDAAPLPLSPTLSAGTDAAIEGYPFGGPFTLVGARVLSEGLAPVPDIYDSGVQDRDIYALAADVQPGNSGGPLLTLDGEVAGVVFAREDSDRKLGYAMTTSELLPVLTQVSSADAAVSTGDCTS